MSDTEHLPGASERARELLNGRSSGTTDPWIPESGDYIMGEVTRRAEVATRWGPMERLWLHASEGTQGGEPLEECHRTVACGCAELRTFLREHDPRVGDTVALHYLGQSGRLNRHGFRYTVDRPDSGTSW